MGLTSLPKLIFNNGLLISFFAPTINFQDYGVKMMEKGRVPHQQSYARIEYFLGGFAHTLPNGLWHLRYSAISKDN